MLAPHRALAVALLLVAGCGGRGGAGREGEPPAPPATLFARLGGMDGVRLLVDDLAARLAADERVQEQFARTDFRRFKARLVVQLCALSGGPCRDGGRSMKEVHAGRGIRPAQFAAFLEDLEASLAAVGAGERERAELIGLLGRMRRDVVSAPRGP